MAHINGHGFVLKWVSCQPVQMYSKSVLNLIPKKCNHFDSNFVYIYCIAIMQELCQLYIKFMKSNIQQFIRY